MWQRSGMELPLNDPGAWEAYRVQAGPVAALGALSGRTDALAAARRVELHILLGTSEAMDNAAFELPCADERLRAGLEVLFLARMGAWHEVRALTETLTTPASFDPLTLEGAALLFLHGGMVARQFGDAAQAERYAGAAGVLLDMLGLQVRGVQARAEALRGRTLAGRGDVGALRALLRDARTGRQREHIRHLIAEELCGRGQYRDALEALSGCADARSVGMACFFRAMLRLPFDDPGGRDDWLRLARCVAGYAQGVIDVADLDMTYEPQATYARLLVAADALLGPEPARAVRVSGAVPPLPHDQRALWAFIRARAVGRGIRVPGAGDLGGVWREGMDGMYDRVPLLRMLALQVPEWVTLLSYTPGARPELVQVRACLPLLTGRDIEYHGRTVAGAGRAGLVLIGGAVGGDIDPFQGSEKKRWDERMRELIRAGELPRLPVNLGEVVRLCRMLEAQGVEMRQTIQAVLDSLSVEAHELVSGALKVVNDETIDPTGSRRAAAERPGER